ncbi:MAG: imidazole glycerol phosphate synthase subunit HisH [bacterium]|nr:imidazole glycerol phosphate synthase subunit HisH [bacterium]
MISKRPKISIVDYGVGNLYSLERAVRLFTDRVSVTEDATEILKSDGVILPGVGSFEAGMKGIKLRGLFNTIIEFWKTGKPILGICLGTQLLMSKGYEFGEFDGLDIIKGRVIKFPKLKNGFKIPHIGWNSVVLLGNKENSVFVNNVRDPIFYFVHSYIFEPDDKKNIFAKTEYGGHRFCSIIKTANNVYGGNVYGCQFHPEKSGEAGLKLIENFINLAK